MWMAFFYFFSFPTMYNFEGRVDLVKFVKAVAAAGLYVHLRIGPYACVEWNYGGFPLWLHFIPGIQFRTDNEPFKAEMKLFTAKIVDMMKQENLYASQGGPIILSQIENEYGDIDIHYGPAAKSYINWAASMATSLDTGVPWVMCQQKDAPADFCEHPMPRSKFEVTFVDSFGHWWICSMSNDWQNQSLCGVEDDWSAFCRVKLLSEERSVELQVSAPDYTIILFERARRCFLFHLNRMFE